MMRNNLHYYRDQFSLIRHKISEQLNQYAPN